MEDMKFGIRWAKDSVNSSTFGIVYRKSCVLEFRYRKSTQNLYNDKLSSFEPVFNPEFGRFLFETKTMGLDMDICSFSFTRAIIHWLDSSSSWWRNTSFLWGGSLYGLWCLETSSCFNCIWCSTSLVKPNFGFSLVTNNSLFSTRSSFNCDCWDDSKSLASISK